MTRRQQSLLARTGASLVGGTIGVAVYWRDWSLVSGALLATLGWFLVAVAVRAKP